MRTTICLCFLILAIHMAGIAIAGLTMPAAPKADVGIVLGSKVEENGTPSIRLAARLDKAAELYRRGVFPLIIASGGHGIEGFPEGTVMRSYLIAQGIPENAVIADNEGINTRATAINVARIMQQKKLASAVVVSQYFHLSRSLLALRQSGVHEISAAAPAFYEWRDIYSLIREAAGIYIYWLTGCK